MDTQPENVSGSAAHAPAALPWSWFDFGGGQAERSTAHPDVEVHTGKVLADGRTVPFRILRHTGAAGTAKPTLILLHGMGLNIATFRGVAAYMVETHNLVLVDYTSFSVSRAWPSGGVSIKAMADTVWRVADKLGLEKISLAGNSLGGGMCLIAALQEHARVERMVLFNPACYPQELPFMYRLSRVPLVGEFFMSITPAEKFIGGIAHIGYVDKTRFEEDLKKRYLLQMGTRENRYRLMDMIRHLPGNARDLTLAIHLERLHEIVQPVLLVWGKRDPLLVPESGPRLANDLPNCRFVEFAELAHMPHEEAAEVVGPVVADFLREGRAKPAAQSVAAAS